VWRTLTFGALAREWKEAGPKAVGLSDLRVVHEKKHTKVFRMPSDSGIAKLLLRGFDQSSASTQEGKVSVSVSIRMLSVTRLLSAYAARPKCLII
jgi:hypothetical protein